MSIFTSLQVDSPISYLIAVILPALDAIVQGAPSETAVTALGVAIAVARIRAQAGQAVPSAGATPVLRLCMPA